jgi:hypothetical protein
LLAVLNVASRLLFSGGAMNGSAVQQPYRWFDGIAESDH